MACDACPRVERQVLTMRNSLQAWRKYVPTDEAGDHTQNR